MSVRIDASVGPLSRWPMAIVLATAALAFAPSLTGGFLGDDFVYVARFRALPWSEWPRLFVQEWSAGIWGIPLRELRPFAALSFMGDARLFGGNPFGYRLTNLALHLIATAAVVRLTWHYANAQEAKQAKTARAAALIAGLVFALHPAHAEAVSWITGRVDLQATAAALLFWLGAEVFVAKGHVLRLALTLAAFFVGLFSKELCLFAPLLLLLHWLLLEARVPRAAWRRRLAVLGGVIAILVIYHFCRRAAFGSEDVHNLWGDAAAWQRQASYGGWLVGVLPVLGRVEGAQFPSLALSHALWLAFAGVVAVGLGVALWRGARHAAAALFFGGVWYFASVFPLTAVGYFSPRHLYFPTVGLAIGIGLACGAARWRAILGVLLIGWCVVAHGRALQPWQANAAISREAIAALDRELALAGAEAVALIAVPEARQSVWLWAWSSPACVRAPFLAHPPAHVLERPGNYARVDRWSQDRRPVETVRAARAAVALFVDPKGRIHCRRVAGAELERHVDALARIAPAGLTSETWTDWVKSVAEP